MGEVKEKYLSREFFLTLLQNNKALLIAFLLGLILIIIGAIFIKGGINLSGTKVEVLEGSPDDSSVEEITVEISGEVERPGVYKLPIDSRIEDLLITAGGFSENADREWSDKYLNRAAKLTDSQKIYIPKIGEQTLGVSAKENGGDQNVSPSFSADSNNLVNINTSSLSDLDKLPGIGPVYGQSIIDHRPYSNVEDLVKNGAIKQNVYEKIKNLISVY